MPITDPSTIDARHQLAYDELNDAGAAIDSAMSEVFAEARSQGVVNRHGDPYSLFGGDTVTTHPSFSVDQNDGLNNTDLQNATFQLQAVKSLVLEQIPDSDLVGKINSLISALDNVETADMHFENGAVANAGQNGFPANRVAEIQKFADAAQREAEAVANSLDTYLD